MNLSKTKLIKACGFCLSLCGGLNAASIKGIQPSALGNTAGVNPLVAEITLDNGNNSTGVLDQFAYITNKINITAPTAVAGWYASYQSPQVYALRVDTPGAPYNPIEGKYVDYQLSVAKGNWTIKQNTWAGTRRGDGNRTIDLIDSPTYLWSSTYGIYSNNYVNLNDFSVMSVGGASHLLNLYRMPTPAQGQTNSTYQTATPDKMVGIVLDPTLGKISLKGAYTGGIPSDVIVLDRKSGSNATITINGSSVLTAASAASQGFLTSTSGYFTDFVRYSSIGGYNVVVTNQPISSGEVAIGNFVSLGSQSVAYGNNIYVDPMVNQSVSLGYAISIGNGADFSTVVGVNSNAYGYASSAFGFYATSEGANSLALAGGYSVGQTSLAAQAGYSIGSSSIAIGGLWSQYFNGPLIVEGNKSIGEASTAFGGIQNETRGFASYAMGNHLVAESAHSFTMGSLNTLLGGDANVWHEEDILFALGNGDPTYNIVDQGFDYWINGPENNSISYLRSNAITTLKNGQTTLTNKEWKAAETNQSAFTPSVTNSQGNALVVEGNTVAKGNIVVKSQKVILISPAGDIDMGEFANGTNPELGE